MATDLDSAHDVDSLLTEVRNRKAAGDRWGVGVAAHYLKSPSVFGAARDFAGCDPAAWEAAVKEAESKLTWCDPGMEITGIVGGTLTDEDLTTLDKRFGVPEIKRVRKLDLPGAVAVVEAVVTTKAKDRDGDILDPMGAEIDDAMPILWQHNSMAPIGKLIEVTKQNSKQVKILFALIDSDLGRDAAALVEFGAIRRMSHGFLPMEWEELPRGKDGDFAGWHFKRYEMMEASLVSVASNRGAMVGSIQALGEEKFCTPACKALATAEGDAKPEPLKVTVRVGDWEKTTETYNKFFHHINLDPGEIAEANKAALETVLPVAKETDPEPEDVEVVVGRTAWPVLLPEVLVGENVRGVGAWDEDEQAVVVEGLEWPAGRKFTDPGIDRCLGYMQSAPEEELKRIASAAAALLKRKSEQRFEQYIEDLLG